LADLDASEWRWVGETVVVGRSDSSSRGGKGKLLDELRMASVDNFQVRELATQLSWQLNIHAAFC